MYATIEDIKSAVTEEYLISLVDDEGTGDVNAQRVLDAIGRAEAEINAYVGKVAALPLATIPPILKRLSIDITLYHLFSRRRFDELKERGYHECVRILKDIASGLIGLGEAAPDATRHLTLYEL